MIDRDVTQGIAWFSGKAAERQILTPELAAAIFKIQKQLDEIEMPITKYNALVQPFKKGNIRLRKTNKMTRSFNRF